VTLTTSSLENKGEKKAKKLMKDIFMTDGDDENFEYIVQGNKKKNHKDKGILKNKNVLKVN